MYKDVLSACEHVTHVILRQLTIKPNNQLVQFICDLWAKNITELNLTLCPGTSPTSQRCVLCRLNTNMLTCAVGDGRIGFEPKSVVSFHLEPIIGALTHNTYFKSITIEDVARKEVPVK